MELFPDLNNEEKILLITGIFSLLYSFSYSFNFCKVILGFINYTETGAYSLVSYYINVTLWYCHSVLIEHEYLQGCYWYSSWIVFVLLNLYLSYEYYFDKFDTLLNFLIILIMHSTLYKIFILMYDDEYKTNIFCGFTQTMHLISLLHWVYKSIINKNARNLNIYVGITLIFYSCSLIVYGEVYQNYFILFPSFGGVSVGLIYIAGWVYLNQLYPQGTEEFGASQSLEIEDKSESNKNKHGNKKIQKYDDEEENIKPK